MRAGAPDNVTCIIGDLVDLDKEQAPPTAHEVVGAAAERRLVVTHAIPVTPAAKAAALSRRANAAAEAESVDEPDSLRLAEEGPASGGRHWFRGLFLLVLVAAVLTGGGYAAHQWAQQQYFVGQAKGHVAIYQGISQNIGPWNLSQVIDESDIALGDLPGFYRNKVDSTITTATVEDARRLVTDLRMQAIQCQTTKAAGGTCGSTVP
jgi:protein phosphatase